MRLVLVKRGRVPAGIESVVVTLGGVLASGAGKSSAWSVAERLASSGIGPISSLLIVRNGIFRPSRRCSSRAGGSPGGGSDCDPAISSVFFCGDDNRGNEPPS